MSVLLYKGGLRLVEKSGVGQAIFHQEEMLSAAKLPAAAGWRDSPDVIHLNTVLPDSVLAALTAKCLGKKVVYYGHSTQEDFRNSFHGSNLLASLFRRWIKFCYSLGDVVITPTEYSKTLLESYGLRRPICALSNGVDTDFFAPNPERGQAFRQKYGISPEEKVVISVGHYIERKGILEFLEVAKRFPDVRFLWFGHTNLNLIPQIVQEAVAAPPENVLFPGFVDRSDLRDAYCGADAFLFLSKEETEGIVVLEALACAVPTIVRDIPVYSGWLRDGENVYQIREDSETPGLLSRLLEGKLPDLTDAGRQTALDRSLGTIGDRLKQVYQSQNLLEKAKSPTPSPRVRRWRSFLPKNA